MKIKFIFSLFLLVSSFVFADRYEVIDLGDSVIELNDIYRMNDKGDVAALVEENVLIYKEGAWSQAADLKLKMTDVLRYTNDGKILAVGKEMLPTENEDGVDYNLHPVIIFPNGKIIDLKNEFDKAGYENLLFTRYVEMNEQGYTLVNVWNKNKQCETLFSFSEKEGIQKIIDHQFMMLYGLNNKNQALMGDFGHTYLHTPGSKPVDLKDFGLNKFVQNFCGYKTEVSHYDLKLSDDGVISGFFGKTFKSSIWPFEDTCFVFTYSPKGELYVAGISEYMKHGKSYFKEWDLEPPLFYTGNPINKGTITAFPVFNDRTNESYWPIFKSENSSFAKRFDRPEEFEEDEDLTIISKMTLDSENKIKVLGYRNQESEFRNIYLWSENKGVQYLNTKVSKEWKSQIESFEFDGDCILSPNGDILHTCVYVKDKGERTLLFKYHK